MIYGFCAKTQQDEKAFMGDQPVTPSLFVPNHYAADDPAAIVRRYPFGLVVTSTSAGFFSTSTPMYFEPGSADQLFGHMARRNPQAAVLESGQQALAIFSGPNAYVSGSWYREKPEVPTWNYVSAHVRGSIEPIDDDAGQLEILRRTAAIQEEGNPNPWTLDQAESRVAVLLPYIRSFRMKIERIEGVTKLSQSHPESDRHRVIGHLLQSGEANSAEIARLMSALEIG